jgi:hypothetical protein
MQKAKRQGKNKNNAPAGAYRIFAFFLLLFDVAAARSQGHGAPRASPWYLIFSVNPDGLPAGAESRPRRPHSSTGKPVVFWGVDKKTLQQKPLKQITFRSVHNLL